MEGITHREERRFGYTDMSNWNSERYTEQSNDKEERRVRRLAGDLAPEQEPFTSWTTKSGDLAQ